MSNFRDYRTELDNNLTKLFGESYSGVELHSDPFSSVAPDSYKLRLCIVYDVDHLELFKSHNNSLYSSTFRDTNSLVIGNFRPTNVEYERHNMLTKYGMRYVIRAEYAINNLDYFLNQLEITAEKAFSERFYACIDKEIKT